LCHRGGVIGLREDRADDRRDGFAGALGHGREHIPHEMHAAGIATASPSSVFGCSSTPANIGGFSILKLDKS
jgi:hypothetical protein